MARTPAQIQAWLDDSMHKLDLGVQMLGTEPNAARRDWDTATTRWCLIASWPYEAAAGNQSIPAVYKAIHDADPGNLCDRFYLPATPGDLRLMQKNNVPAFGIESKHPITDFDVIGTSISYPVLTMSFLKMLTMSGIPARWRTREAQRMVNDLPMVMVGGLSYGAPEVLAPVVDCWFLGEVEDEPGNPGIGAVTDRIAAYKRLGRWTTDRLGCYAELAREFNFLYFPRFVKVHYRNEDRSHVGVGPRLSKQVVGYTSLLDGMRLPFRKRHVRDLDAIAPLDNPPLLYADPAMGSGDLEVARGCPAWCSFCSLAWKSKPYRQMSVPKVIDYAKALQDNMGSTRMAPFSPDLPMYTERRRLISELLEKVSDEVDAPSMRVDDFTADNTFILLQVHGGMDSVSLGVEGNSQRMRDLVGKGTADADVKEAVTRGIRAGIRKFKLYMISNLPGEDEGDVYRILKLAKELADIRESMGQPNIRIQFSWTPFLIEANTPVQWFATQPANRILGDVWEELRDLKIDSKLGAKAEENKLAFFQLCQRASRDVGEALVDAMLEVDQACWGGVPRTFKDTIEAKLHEWGFVNGYADCFDERLKHDLFGWEFIDTGVSNELLWQTYVQMREFAEYTDSHSYDLNFDASYHGSEWVSRCDERCMGKTCGVCDHGDLRERQRILRAVDADVELATLHPVDQHSQAVRIRAKITKNDSLRFVGNDHWRFLFRRACFRAQTRLGWSHGIAKRSIRFASDEVKHRDWTAGCDYVEFAFTRPLTDVQITAFLRAIDTHLEDRMHVHEWTRHRVDAVSIRADVDQIFEEVEIDEDLTHVQQRLAWWQDQKDVPMRLKIEGGYFAPGSETVNAKDFVHSLWTKQDGHRLLLRMLVKGRPNPYNVVAALLGKPTWLPYARHPARRLDVFIATDPHQQDFLRPTCTRCGLGIPITLLDQPFDPDFCPRCLDEDQP
jgi:radical SAM superfamily enzyme YgiQ (UPF0313 family)